MFLFFIILTLLMTAVVYFDATRYLIPNWLVGLVLAAWPLMLLMSPVPVPWVSALLVMLATFAAGYLIFIFRIMGGGDVKLLTVCALWAGWPNVMPFMVWTAIFGGGLSVFLIVIRKLLPEWVKNTAPEHFPRIFRKGEPAPYGLAIAAGFLFMLWQQQLPGLVLK